MKTPSFYCRLILIGLCVLAGELQAQDPPPNPTDPTVTLLILPFDNATGDPSLDAASKSIPDLVAAFLASGTDRIGIVNRQAMEQIYQEKSLTWQGFLESPADPNRTRLAQAGHIVRGSLARAQHSGDDIDAIEIHLFLHETTSTRLLKSFQAQGPPDKMVSLCQQAAESVAAFFQADLPPVEPLPLDDNPEKNLLMIHGLSAWHNGQPHRAIACLLKILDRHPADEAAQFWLAKSFFAADLHRHAQIQLEQFLEQHPRSRRTNEARRLLKTLDQTRHEDLDR